MDDLTTLSYGSAHTQPPHLARPHGPGRRAKTTHSASATRRTTNSSDMKGVSNRVEQRNRHHSHPLSSGSGSSRTASRGTVQSSHTGSSRGTATSTKGSGSTTTITNSNKDGRGSRGTSQKPTTTSIRRRSSSSTRHSHRRHSHHHPHHRHRHHRSSSKSSHRNASREPRHSHSARTMTSSPSSSLDVNEVSVTRDGSSRATIAVDALSSRARLTSQPPQSSHSLPPPSPRRRYVTDLLRDATPPTAHSLPSLSTTSPSPPTSHKKSGEGVNITKKKRDSVSGPASEANHESASDAVRALESSHIATQQQLEVVYRLYRRLRSHNAGLESEFRKLRTMLMQLRGKLARQLASRVRRAQSDMHALREFVRLVCGDYQDALQHTQRVLLAVLAQPGLLTSDTPVQPALSTLRGQYSQPLHSLSVASHHSQDWYKTLSPPPTSNIHEEDEQRQQQKQQEHEYHNTEREVNAVRRIENGNGEDNSRRIASSRSYRDWPALSIIRNEDASTSPVEGVGGQTLRLLPSPSPAAKLHSSQDRRPADYYPNTNTTVMSIPSPSDLLRLPSQLASGYGEDNDDDGDMPRDILSTSAEDGERNEREEEWNAEQEDPTASLSSTTMLRQRLAAAQKQVVLLSRKMAQNEQHWRARLGRLREIHVAREMALREQVRLLQFELSPSREPERHAAHAQRTRRGGRGDEAANEKEENTTHALVATPHCGEATPHAELRMPSTGGRGEGEATGRPTTVIPHAVRKAVTRVASAQDNTTTTTRGGPVSREGRKSVSHSVTSLLPHQTHTVKGGGETDEKSAQAAWARRVLAARGVTL